MVAGTKRGLLLLGLHNFFVQALIAVFSALFVEYYLHECLLVLKTKPSAKAKGQADSDKVQLQLSKWRFCLFTIAQTVHVTLAVLHKAGLLSSAANAVLRWRATSPLRRLSSEHLFALAFGLSWWLLRFPLMPSAVSFTLAFAAFNGLAETCASFTAQAAREMATQRPREGEWITPAARVASAGVSAVVFAAAFAYDGTTAKSGSLRGFHQLLLALTVAALCVFSGLQYLRRGTHADETLALARDDGESLGSPRLPLASFEAPAAELRSFAQQTCQRRSMKALLAVRALHSYAHTFVLHLFHLLLLLGCGLHLSHWACAGLLAFVVGVSSIMNPACAVLCAWLGKKRTLSLCFALVATLGVSALPLSYVTRDAAQAAKGVLTKPAEGKSTGALDASAAGTVLCAVFVVLQRLLLDALRELLDLAQEDVVEEDAILFGRASLMTVWTKRLCAMCTTLTQALSFVMSLLLLAAAQAFRGVWSGAPAAASAGSTTGSASPPRVSALLLVANGSTVLVVLGLQTSGVALAMLVIWQRFYNLDGKHLQFVQMATRKRKDEQSLALV